MHFLQKPKSMNLISKIPGSHRAVEKLVTGKFITKRKM